MVGKRAPLLHLSISIDSKLVGGGRFGQCKEIHATHVRGLGEPRGCWPRAYAGHTHSGIVQLIRHRFGKRAHERLRREIHRHIRACHHRSYRGNIQDSAVSVCSHVTTITVRKLSQRGYIELHHLMLAMPVGVEKTRPIRKTGVIDEMIHLKILRNRVIMQLLRCVRLA